MIFRDSLLIPKGPVLGPQGGHVEACRVLLTMRPSPEAHASALRAAEHTCSGAVIAQMLRGYEVHS